MLGPPATVTKR